MSNTPIQHRGRFIEATLFLQQNIEYDSDGNAIYIGFAAPGTLNSETGWMIVHNYNDSNGAMTNSRFADNSIEFDKIWDSRKSYTYDRS